MPDEDRIAILEEISPSKKNDIAPSVFETALSAIIEDMHVNSYLQFKSMMTYTSSTDSASTTSGSEDAV
jgi:Mg/Co/Ni transporter MgtE